MANLENVLERFRRDFEPKGWTFNIGTAWKPNARLYLKFEHQPEDPRKGKQKICITGYASGDDLALALDQAMNAAERNHANWLAENAAQAA